MNELPIMPQLSISQTETNLLLLELAGSWTLSESIPDLSDLQKRLDGQPSFQRVTFSVEGLTDWDSGLLTFLIDLKTLCDERGVVIEPDGLPDGVRKLIRLAYAVPEKKGARRENSRETLFEKVGRSTIELVEDSNKFLSFLGAATLSFFRLLRGKAGFQRADLLMIMEDCGSSALPIVSLISLLVGLIMGFVGSIQLERFGAQIFVADLVGIATAREMGAMMTAIIMSGRTGAAFAAQLGTMQVNEEIDALRTFGIEPMDFLVLPRMLALILMMPVLTLYANLLGIAGGAMVGVAMLDISLTQYINQTTSALSLTDFGVGLVKSIVFGVLIALSGCLKGMECGRSATAVGSAVTSAVVMGIVLIIATDGLFAVVTSIMGI